MWYLLHMTDRSEQLPLPLVEGAESPPRASGDLQASISREALNALPIRSFQGPVTLVDDDAGLVHALAEIQREELLGFDTETKPVFRAGVSHPPALIQLAGKEKAWIFQLRNIKRLKDLFGLLSHPGIKKVGIAIADDIKKLKELQDFEPESFIEIGDLARKLGYAQTGLRTLAGLVLGYRVSKREQRSNWARQQLTPAQIAYAATDAWVSRELYCALIAQIAAHEK